MSTSGTYTLSMEIAEFVDESFERAGLDPAMVTARHAKSARVSLNLMFAEWLTKKGIMPFICEAASNIAFVASQATYTVPAGTMAILQPMFVRSSVATPIQLIGRDDYQRIPNKTQNGITAQMFYDRPSSTIYAWPRGESASDAFSYWRLRRVQDVSTAAENPDVPYQGYEALASGLAAKLALKFNPDKFVLLEQLANRALDEFADFERERAPVSFGIAGM